MDWFEELTGFPETTYDEVRAKLNVKGYRLESLVNQRSYGIGELELASLGDLRDRVNAFSCIRSGRLKVNLLRGDARLLHQSPEYVGAVFQVASQFNLLEMVAPTVTPEDGVTRYQYDQTQGPACAIAAGAATIYRNYFAQVSGQSGQTRERQLDGLAKVGQSLSGALEQPVGALWKMQNGYALCSQAGLQAISKHIGNLEQRGLDSLRGELCIGMHWDVEVTDCPGENRPSVSQAFCSALPVAYSSVPAQFWEAFARLVLEAAYEATLWAAVLNANRGRSNVVLLTSLGGGAFGNDERWIQAAMRRALQMVNDIDLDVKLVSHGTPSRGLSQLAADFRQ
jgi:hypothetical protein